MMNWLVDESELFGLAIQNWMLAIGGGLLIYIAILTIARRHQPR
jgi:hypothetical protein